MSDSAAAANHPVQCGSTRQRASGEWRGPVDRAPHMRSIGEFERRAGRSFVRSGRSEAA